MKNKLRKLYYFKTIGCNRVETGEKMWMYFNSKFINLKSHVSWMICFVDVHN
jgi:hypothetical protein